MNLLSVTPMLTVLSIKDAVDFYCSTLGFRRVASAEGWACVSLDSVEVMFALPNQHLPFSQPQMTGSLYFRSNDVAAWWEQLKDCCRVEYPLEDFEYGMREFAIRDNSGYLLQFGQERG